jgi:hypothetical protein
MSAQLNLTLPPSADRLILSGHTRARLETLIRVQQTRQAVELLRSLGANVGEATADIASSIYWRRTAGGVALSLLQRLSLLNQEQIRPRNRVDYLRDRILAQLDHSAGRSFRYRDVQLFRLQSEVAQFGDYATDSMDQFAAALLRLHLCPRDSRRAAAARLDFLLWDQP